MIRKSNLLLALFLASLFFIAGLLTLPHYGINWDTINHLPRGQAYLHFFLTGKTDYSDLPVYKPYWQNPESLGIDTTISKDQVPSRSYYQSDAQDYAWYMKNGDGGHPPLSDIISSIFNRVLFGKLRLINDIDAYRVYSVFLASCLVALVFYWVDTNYGKIAGFVSALSLALYPLFWAESHFNNEKDIPEAVFWSFMIFCFWKGFTSKRSLWILISGLFFGLVLGTKFNVLFIPLVLLPWLAFYWVGKYAKKFSVREFFSDNAKMIISAFVAAIMGIFIFIMSWPYLWPDPIYRIMSVFDFYKAIGLTQDINPNFIGPMGTKTYALTWIITTTPPVILFLSLVGIIFSLIRISKGKSKTYLLFLLWFIIPIARVTWPGTTIYGGVRQILEYVPAMALLAGIGVSGLINIFKTRKLLYLTFIFTVFALYLATAVTLYKIHPNENVYFNFLIGGLSGAREKDIPFWGNSFGGAYRQGIVWMNKNLPQGAKIAFARELLPNIPTLWLRPDLTLHNSFRSGYLKKGEYVITLTYQGVEKTSYFDEYLDRYLYPVYEVKVDSVSILKVWKNDAEHTKEAYLSEKETHNYKVSIKDGTITLNFDKTIYLSRIELSYKQDNTCLLSTAYIQTSGDGEKWDTLPGVMPNEDWSVPQIGAQPRGEKAVIPFAAERLRYVRIISVPSDSCLMKIKSLKVYYLDKL